jgi:hypothetical protein
MQIQDTKVRTCHERSAVLHPYGILVTQWLFGVHATSLSRDTVERDKKAHAWTRKFLVSAVISHVQI